MLQSVDENTDERLSRLIDEFISNNYAPGCTELFFKLFYQCYSDPLFSMTEDEKLAMERISDLLLTLWMAEKKKG